MHFTPSIAASVLAFASSAMAVPTPADVISFNSTATSVTSTATSQATATAGSSSGLSLTQQLFLSDTRADFFKLLPNDKDFVFDFNQKQMGAGKGGNLIAANRKTFPALVGSGSGMVVATVDPCGFNTPHVHPRGTELQIVVKGRLITEMVPENGVLDADGKRRLIKNEIGPFTMTPFYQGSIHTQFNPDCEEAVFVASFPTEDFGTGQIADETFTFTDDVIAASFGQSIAGKDIDKVRQAIPTSLALGVEECLKKCNIPKSQY